MRGKSAEEQQAAVAKVLRGLMPRHLPYIVRTFFKPNKLALQLNAMFTPPIFSWLVGPAEVSIIDIDRADSEFRGNNWFDAVIFPLSSGRPGALELQGDSPAIARREGCDAVSSRCFVQLTPGSKIRETTAVGYFQSMCIPYGFVNTCKRSFLSLSF
jgi:hypothetical protein